MQPICWSVVTSDQRSKGFAGNFGSLVAYLMSFHTGLLGDVPSITCGDGREDVTIFWMEFSPPSRISAEIFVLP